MTTEYRTYHPELEVRSGGDGRTIYGIAVPYNAPMRITADLVEQFELGAFAHQMRTPNRVKLAREHLDLGGTLIGALSLMRDDPIGLYVEMRASKTPVGDETLELVRDGALNHLSIAFHPRQNRRLAGGVTARVKADLEEVAVTLKGAYGELATAAGVRSAAGAEAELVEPSIIDLRARAEGFFALPDLEDNDIKVRALRLGLPLR